MSKSRPDSLDRAKAPTRGIASLKDKIKREGVASVSEQRRLLRFYGQRHAQRLQTWLVRDGGLPIRHVIADIKREPGRSQPRRSALMLAKPRRAW